jgi:hypothetical protein
MRRSTRRRLSWTGTGLGAVVVTVGVVWLIRPAHDSRPRSASASKSSSAASPASSASDDGHVPHNFYERGHVVGKLVYGITEQQVRRRVGRPVKVIRWQGLPCWQYPINEHYPATSAGPGYTLNAVAACFLAGRYAAPRYKIDGKWGYNLLTKQVTD